MRNCDKLFHDYRVLGEIELNDPEVIKQLRDELRSQIDSDSGRGGILSFWPRHGVRAFKGGQIRDYLICFECQHLYIYNAPEGDKVERIGLEGPSENVYFNKLLDDAGIPRAKPISCCSE